MESSQTQNTAQRGRRALWVGAGLGLLSSIAVIALFYAGEQLFELPFVPFDIFDWMSRVLPGGLIAFVISTMVSIISFVQGFLPIGDTSTVAKAAEQTIAILQVVGGGAIFGLILAWLNRKGDRDLTTDGLIGGLILLAVTLFIINALSTTMLDAESVIWLGAVFLAWGWVLARLVQYSMPALAEEPEAGLSRRQFLTVSGAGLSAVALGAWGIAALFGDDAVDATANGAQAASADDPFGANLTSGPAASPSAEELAARPAPVDGTRPELTSNEDFYRIDINTRALSVAEENWALTIAGMVEEELRLTLDELKAMPSQTQILTMQCISNQIGGDLTSSTRWTGVRFKDVLAQAGIQDGVAGAYIEAIDGFFEFVVMDDIMDDRTLLVYAMNGEDLPSEHGFPLRIYIPNRYGMKQPKWIETIELTEARVDGYWVVRGWDAEAIPKTVSVVDTVVVDPDEGDNGSAMAGGIAWAGGRGISSVEVQVDDSDWQSAELIAPPMSPLSWVLWRYAWPYEVGRHTVRVRAYDGEGQLQVLETTSTRPDGATGIHSITVNL